MPGFDRKGPVGEGPRTGRQMGKCRPLENDSKVVTEVEETEEIMEGKRIAVALANNGSHSATVSAHFGRCPAYGVWRIERGVPIKQEVVSNPFFQQHTPGAVPEFIQKIGANVMIAGGMGPRAIKMFGRMGIEVVTGAMGNPEKVVGAYLCGDISGIVACSHDHESSCGGH